MKEAIKMLDDLFYKYGIKEKTNELGYRNNFINYIESLENTDLQNMYNEKGFLYEFIELSKQIGLKNDLLNYYTMLVSTSNRKLGQDFTPKSLLEVLSNTAENKDNKNNGILLYEPAGGTGSTLINKYYNIRENRSFFNVDNIVLEVDEYDYYNCCCCAINFAIRGINAIVRNIDTLQQKCNCVFVIDKNINSWFSKIYIIKKKGEIEKWKE